MRVRYCSCACVRLRTDSHAQCVTKVATAALDKKNVYCQCAADAALLSTLYMSTYDTVCTSA
jgi:hypothetical protein